MNMVTHSEMPIPADIAGAACLNRVTRDRHMSVRPLDGDACNRPSPQCIYNGFDLVHAIACSIVLLVFKHP
jgi:hypothetical protein